jgi:hypothetical protein
LRSNFSGSLPLPADSVEELYIDLRAVERATARVDRVGRFAPLDGTAQGVLGFVPSLVRADPLRGARREVEAEAEPEGPVDVVDEVEHGVDLVLDLVGPAEDVRIVHRQPADAEHAVQCARFLVAVVAGDLGVANREITVAGLDPIVLLLPFHLHRREHHLRVGLEVPRSPEERLPRDVRRVDEIVPAAQQLVLEESPEHELDHRALRVPVDQSRPHILLDAEQVELLAEQPVVAPASLLEPPEVFFQV